MPSTAEAEARRRGLRGYRVVKKDGNTFLVAIVDKPGPRGGHTVALRGPVAAKGTKPQPPARKKMTKARLRKIARQRRAQGVR